MTLKNVCVVIVLCFLTIGCDMSSLLEPLPDDYYFCEPTITDSYTGEYISGDYIDLNCDGEFNLDIECRQCRDDNSEFYNEFHLGGCAWEVYVEREYGVCEDE